MVSVYEPVGVLLVVVMFKAEEPEPTTVVGLKLAEAPAGTPVTLNWTVLLKPPDGEMLTL
jgi:hypothetical protein